MNQIHQKDSKTKSISEALINSFGGYPIGYGISIIVLPLSVDWIKDDPFVASLFIGIIFATVSFLRVFLLRRLFEKFGFDDNLIRLIIRAYQRFSLFSLLKLVKIRSKQA